MYIIRLKLDDYNHDSGPGARALYRAVAQTIILAGCKIKCGKKEQEKKVFQCYVVHGVGMLNFIGNL